MSLPKASTPAILRRLDQIPWWTAPLARHLFARERRALALVGHLGISPRLLLPAMSSLVRSFIDGVALHVAQADRRPRVLPRRAPRLARAASRPRHAITISTSRRTGSAAPTGNAYLTDFQLAFVFSRRSKLFRHRRL